MNPSKTIRIVVFFGLLCCIGNHAQAATVYWDPNGQSTGGYGSGTWDTTTPNWYNGSADGPWTDTTGTDTADFAGTSGTYSISVSNNVTTNGITFDLAGSYTLASGTVTLAGATPTITSWVPSTINSAIAGTSGLTVAGPGGLTLGGINSYTGATIVTSGVVNGGSNPQLVLNSSGVAIPGDLVVGNISSGTSSGATVVQAAAANQFGSNSVIRFDASTQTIGNSSNNYGYLELMGHSQTVAGISDTDAAGIIENTESVNGAASSVLTVNNSANFTFNGYVRDHNPGFTGTLGLTKSGTGMLTLSGASITYTGPTNVTGGTLVYNTNNFGPLGTAGQINISAGAAVQSLGILNLKVATTANLSNASNNVVGAGTLVLASTNVGSASAPDLYFAPDASGSSYYGAKVTVKTLDLGSSQRYFYATSGSNSVANYPTKNDAYISSNIIGTGGITFAGAQYSTSVPNLRAELILAGTNSFTGALQVDRGGVFLGGSMALTQSNTLILNNPVSTYYSHFFLWGNNATISNLQSSGVVQQNTAVANGNPTMSTAVAAATLTTNQTANTTFAGTIADTVTDGWDKASGSVPGALSLVKSGTATLTLAGSNTYSGSTAVTAGTLQIGGGSTTGSLGATTRVTFSNNATLAFNRSDSVSFPNVISGNGNVTQFGTGLLTLSGSDSYNGGTIVANGNLLFANTGSVPSSGLIKTTGGALQAAGAYSTVTAWLPKIDPASSGAIALTGSSTENINMASDPTLSLGAALGTTATYSGTLTPAGNTYYLGGGGGQITFSTLSPSGAANVVLGDGGGGTVVFPDTANPASTNTYTGSTTLNGGVLVAPVLANGGSPSTIGQSSSDAGNLVFNGGTLNYTGISASIDRAFTVQSGGAGIGVAAGQTLTISGLPIAAGKYAFTKSGSGNLALSAPNALSPFGAIAVNGGDLQAGATTLGNGVTSVSIASGATFTSTGTVNLAPSLSAEYSVTSGSGTWRLRATGTSPSNPDIWYSPAGVGKNSTVRIRTAIDTGSTGDNRYVNVNSNNNNFVGQNDGDLWISGNLTGGGNLVYTGSPNPNYANQAATFALSGNDSAWTGSVTVNSGLFISDNTNALTAANGVTLAPALGQTAEFRLWNSNNTIGQLSSSGAGSSIVSSEGITTNPLTLTVQQNSNTTYGGQLTNSDSGVLSFVKAGSGNLALTGINSGYAGTTTISGGVLGVAYLNIGGNNSSLGASSSAASNLTINGGTLQHCGGASSTDRLFTLGSAGGAIDASGSGPLTWTNNGALAFSGTGPHTLTLCGGNTGSNTLSAVVGDQAPLTGPTSLVKSGPGTWITARANSYTGTTTIAGGVLGVAALANGGVVGSLGAASNNASNLVITNGTLQYTGPATFTDRLFTLGGGSATIDASGSGLLSWTNTGSPAFSAAGPHTLVLTGSGAGSLAAVFGDQAAVTGQTSLVKTGLGTWTMGTSGSYTGTTIINAGILQLPGGSTYGSPFTLNGGALAVANDNSPVQTTTFGGLSLTGAGVIDLTAGSSWNKSTAMIGLTGPLSLTGTTTVNVASLGTLSANTTYPLIGGATLLSGGTANLVLGALPSRVTASLIIDSLNPKQIDLQVKSYDTIKWSGAVNAAWDINTTQNWKSVTYNTTQKYLQTTAPGDTVTFDDSASGNFNVNLDTALQPASVTVNSNNHAYTFAGSGKISGTALVTKASTSNLTILTNNDYTGGTAVNGGTLTLGDGVTAGSGSIVGNVSLSNTATGTAVLQFNRPDNATFAGIISGSGSLVQAGGGVVTLTAPNTYVGPTVISGGSLQLGAGGTSGSIASDVQNNGTIVFNRSDAVIFANVISGNGSLNQFGLGATILTGSNTYSGSTTISAGTLQLGNGGTTGSIASDVQNNGMLVFNRSDSVMYAGQINGSGGVNQSGAGLLMLANDSNTYSGPTTLSGGTLSVDYLGYGMYQSPIGASSSDPANLVINGGQLLLSGASAYSSLYTDRGFTVGAAGGSLGISDSTVTLNFTGTATGSGSFSKEGPGTLVLDGPSSTFHPAVTNINGGTLQVGSLDGLGGLGNGPIVVNNGALVFARSDGGLTLANAISGSGAVVFNGTGIAYQSSYTLSGTNGQLTGPITLNSSRVLAGQGNLGTGPVTVTPGSGVLLTGGSFSNGFTIAGDGWLETTGDGYLGAIRLSGSATVSGPISLAGNARITAYGSAGTISGTISEVIPGTVLEIGAGTADTTGGTVILSASNSYTGGTTLRSSKAYGVSMIKLGNINGLGTGPLTVLTNGDTSSGGYMFLDTTLLTGYQKLANNIALPSDGTRWKINMANGAGNTLELSGQISGGSGGTGTSGLSRLYLDTPVQTANGTFHFSGHNTFNALVYVDRGSLMIDSDDALGSSGNWLFLDSGGQKNDSIDRNHLTFVNPMTFDHNTALGWTDAVLDTAGNDVRFTAPITTDFGDGIHGIVKSGFGSLELDANNTYVGATVTQGTLKVGNSGALGTGGLTVSSGTVDLNGISPRALASFSGTGGMVLNNGSSSALLTVSQTSTTTYAGTLADGASRLSLLVAGSGTLVLTGSNTYTGGTDVTAGTLILANNSAIADGTGLTVGADAMSIFGVSAAGMQVASPNGVSHTSDLVAVPEPGTLALLAVAGLATGLTVWRRRTTRCRL